MNKKELIQKIEKEAIDYFGENFKKLKYLNDDLIQEMDFVDSLNLDFYIQNTSTGHDYYLELGCLIKAGIKSFGAIIDFDLQIFECEWEDFVEFILEWKEKADNFKAELLSKIN